MRRVRRTTALHLVITVLAGVLLVGVTPPARAAVPPLGPDFEFGVAQSGFQSEGYNRDSNWLRYGKQGKVDQPVGNAVDFYHRYAEDIDRAASLGVGIYRTSVEWSRVEPVRGQDDPAGWAFYDRVIRKVVDVGMRPMITLNHWVHPGWAVDLGGWNRPGMADDMVAFAARVVDRYAWAGPLWITFNEPTEYVRREAQYGGLAPQNMGRMTDGIVAAHRAIYRHIHRVQPGAQVSSNFAYYPIVGLQPWLESIFPQRMSDTLDFVGVDHYYSFSVTDASVAYGALGDFWKSSQAPESIYYVLRHVARQFPGKPIRVIENGLATGPDGRRPDGYRRADHLRDTVYWLQRARQDGIDVTSYNYWSLTDNYEWGDFDSRFGLFTVDAQRDPTLTRRPTDAVAAYREITRAGGVSAGYRPTRLPVPCSLVDVTDSCAEPATVR